MSNSPAYNARLRQMGAAQGGEGLGMDAYASPPRHAGYMQGAPAHMNEMRGGDVTDFVSQVTRVVSKGSRAFAILDSDKYLPLTGVRDCPRPMGLHMRVGQWLKVQARLNTNSSNNPWTCTRVYCQVDGPCDQPQHPWVPPQHMYAGAKRGAGEMMSAGEFGRGGGHSSQHGRAPKIPWQHGPDARQQDAGPPAASAVARGGVSYGVDSPPASGGRGSGPGSQGDSFWARRAADAAAAVEQGETGSRPWQQEAPQERPQAHPGRTRWPAQQGQLQQQHDFWTADGLQHQTDASGEGAVSARGPEANEGQAFKNGHVDPDRMAAGSEGARWQQQQQQHPLHDLPPHMMQHAEEGEYAPQAPGARSWQRQPHPSLPHSQSAASNGNGARDPYYGANDGMQAGLHGGMPRTPHRVHQAGYGQQDGGVAGRGPWGAQAHSRTQQRTAPRLPQPPHFTPRPASGGHHLHGGMYAQGTQLGSAPNIHAPHQQMMPRPGRPQPPAPLPEMSAHARQELEPAALMRELQKIKRIHKLLQFLDHTLRTSSWPSSSADACAALFKTAK